ncbi:Dol-P-Glc:Glc(2)Man(9)GlcNAc(2)-PP-Dol alpha-1-2-glucosyltransferase [Penicillium chermesinum]|nr:Dol-P-Glc:Glc(2)Man(9)GlcNAc(2)-PP-Dol alpha-1-2-glucosyltransferase [Penicillium chermesinum]
MSSSRGSNLSRAARYAVPFGLVLIPVWRNLVNTNVPEPYLDEVFHVPQAQTYWAHKWTQWDPKITTPPGLYLWSYLLCAALLTLRGSPTQLDTAALRTTNVATTGGFPPMETPSPLGCYPKGAWLSHTVLNICLFPPLFFFSALYYTDILALLAVVEAYNWDLKRASRGGSLFLSTLGFLVFGLAALVCRQTNIFWVSVFLGGLQVVRTIRKSSKVTSSSGISSVIQGALKNEVYDPPVSTASLPDYFKVAVSLAVAALKNTVPVLVSILPHILILAVFGAFVIWNNGVVLGHKEFHTAGIHLAQMLYIWPYFVFFSWPLLILPAVNIVLPKTILPKYPNYGLPEKQRKLLPTLISAALVIPLLLVIVHFNTLVHPFTLADNRHYVFYVFRLLLNIHPAVKYAAVVVYFACGWAVISALGFTISTAPRLFQLPPGVKPGPRKPEAKTSPAPKEITRDQPKGTRKSTRTTRKSPSKTQPEPAKPDPVTLETFASIQEHLMKRRQEQADSSPRVSFVLVWLAATALSLVTAPLVEPRYFIIPWVMWRLHLPAVPALGVFRRQPAETEQERVRSDLAGHVPVFLETAWFMLINAVTGYVFLYKGFEWPQEPGKVQRFMW